MIGTTKAKSSLSASEDFSPKIVPRRVYVVLFVFSLLAFSLSASGRYYSIDGMVMFAMSKAIVNDHSIVIQKYLGTKYSKYGPLQSILAVPFYAAAKPLEPMIARLAPGKGMEDWPFGLFNVVVTSISVVVMAMLAAELGAGPLAAVVVALLWGFATMAWPYAKQCFSEPLLTLCVLLAFFYEHRALRRNGAKDAWLAGIFLGLSVLTKYANVAMAPVFGLVMLFGRRDGGWKRAIAFSVPVIASVGLILLYNYGRFGDFTETGYNMAHEMRKYKPPGVFIDAVYGVLFSGSKSVFLYSPPLLLAIIGAREFWARSRALTVTVIGTLAVYFLVYTRVAWWGGGMCWGPRYFMPLVGMGMAMTAPFVARALSPGGGWRKSLLIVLAVAGIGIQIIAVSMRMNVVYENGSAPDCVHWMIFRGADYTKEELRRLPRICANPIVKEYRILKERTPRMASITVKILSGASHHPYFEHTYLDYWEAYLLPFLPKSAAWALVGLTLALAGGCIILFAMLLRLASAAERDILCTAKSLPSGAAGRK